MNRLETIVEKFPGRRVVVFGDLVADVFVYGEISRISREAPVLILNHKETQVVPGGGANAIHNLAALGAKPYPVGIVGNDPEGHELLKCFSNLGIDIRGIRVSKSYRTPTKMRILGGAVHSQRQQIVLNESTMWSGGPYDADRPDAHRCLPDVRAALFAGDIGKAEALLNANFRYPDGVQGWHDRDQFGCYQVLGQLIPDLAERIVIELQGTPLTHSRYLRMHQGSYGPAWPADRSPFPGGSTPIPNLVLCGSGVFPGIGVPPVAISGEPVANLIASTSGTDSDWVVKLIDVYPDEVAGQPALGGYQLMVAADIFRGRYRESFETAKAIAADAPLLYRFALPTANHVFLTGHRLMVQIQSSWFPLYDRNPQTFVPNIFFARPQDYRKATQRVYHVSSDRARQTFVELPIVAGR